MNEIKATEEMLNKYKKNYIESKRLIPVCQESNGDILYLKDYSKIVRGVGSVDFRGIPERFEEEGLTVLEDPTEEEKVILATNLPNVDNAPYLAAIINGRELLTTMSRDEAAIAANKNYGEIIRGLLLGNTNVAKKAELELVRLTKAYLDGRLYGKSITALNAFANASIISENIKENTSAIESEEKEQIETSQEEVEQTTTIASQPETLGLPLSQENVNEKVETEEKEFQSPATVVEVPTVLTEQTEKVPEAQPLQESVAEPVGSVPVQESTISPEAYNQMLADVVSGAPAETSLGLQEATDLLEQPVVSVIPQVPEVPTMTAQPAVVQPAVQDISSSSIPSPIPVPESITEMTSMIEDTSAPSFDGELGGRGM